METIKRWMHWLGDNTEIEFTDGDFTMTYWKWFVYFFKDNVNVQDWLWVIPWQTFMSYSRRERSEEELKEIFEIAKTKNTAPYWMNLWECLMFIN